MALFVSVQCFSLAHATEHGADEHQHDGVTCEVSLATAQQNVVIPPLPIIIPFSPPVEANWEIDALNTLPRIFDGRAPPPRGPPAH